MTHVHDAFCEADDGPADPWQLERVMRRLAAFEGGRLMLLHPDDVSNEIMHRARSADDFLQADALAIDRALAAHEHAVADNLALARTLVDEALALDPRCLHARRLDLRLAARSGPEQLAHLRDSADIARALLLRWSGEPAGPAEAMRRVHDQAIAAAALFEYGVALLERGGIDQARAVFEEGVRSAPAEVDLFQTGAFAAACAGGNPAPTECYGPLTSYGHALAAFLAGDRDRALRDLAIARATALPECEAVLTGDSVEADLPRVASLDFAPDLPGLLFRRAWHAHPEAQAWLRNASTADVFTIYSLPDRADEGPKRWTEVVRAFLDRLDAEFQASEEAASHRAAHGLEGELPWTHLILSIAAGEFGISPASLSDEDLRVTLEEELPNTLESEHVDTEDLVAELRAYVAFTRRAYRVANAPELTALLDEGYAEILAEVFEDAANAAASARLLPSQAQRKKAKQKRKQAKKSRRRNR